METLQPICLVGIDFVFLGILFLPGSPVGIISRQGQYQVNIRIRQGSRVPIKGFLQHTLQIQDPISSAGVWL